ncbi:hypothetical protein MP638_002464 [Amoeboaphelidium occidentale]|nr:hypothetical protein MP638_002464 [Amoeboaphelidium occidentale]
MEETTLKEEIKLQRLLLSCQTLVDKDRVSSVQDVARYRVYVRMLKNLYAELEQKQAKRYLPLSTLYTFEAQYYRKIQHFSDLIDKVKLQSPIDRGLSSLRSAQTNYTSFADKNKERIAEKSAEQRALKDIKEELFQGASEVTDGTKRRNTTETSSPQSENQVLGQLEKDHEELTGGMLRMVQHLKDNAGAIGDIARQDADAIHNTVLNMQGHSSRFKKLNDQLAELSRRYGSMCLLQICLTLVVVMVFVTMYLFMKIFPKRKRLINIVTETITATPTLSTVFSVPSITASLLEHDEF